MATRRTISHALRPIPSASAPFRSISSWARLRAPTAIREVGMRLVRTKVGQSTATCTPLPDISAWRVSESKKRAPCSTPSIATVSTCCRSPMSAPRGRSSARRRGSLRGEWAGAQGPSARRCRTDERFAHAAVDFVWEAYTDPTAYASLELLIASRTDDDLLAHLRPVADRFEKLLELADLALAPDSMARRQRTALRKLVIAAMQGLAVMRIVNDDDAYVESVLGMLKDLCRKSLGAGGNEES